MAHVCLVNPPGIKTTSGLQMHTPNPPTGLAYIAAAVRAAGHRVTVIDATGSALDQIRPMAGRPDILVQGLTPAQIAAQVPADADALGLSCLFSTLWPISRQVLEAVHSIRPKLPLIVGGEHPTATFEHVLTTSPADVCVLGEGEETIVDLLRVLDGGGDLAEVQGIAFGDVDRVVRTAPRQRIKAVDEIPWPAWDLFPVAEYIARQQMNGIHQGRAMPILGTRGCPFRCTFCSSPQMWTTRYAMRDVSDICDEIELYIDHYGATDFHFQDLTAIVNKQWILAFGDELVRRGLRITWQLPSGTRSEVIDDEVCRMLAATGCKNMAYAPESGSEEIRCAIQKRVKIDHMLGSIRAALRHRLSLSCFFVIGFPQDTSATLRESLRLIRHLAWMGVRDVGVAKFVPYPGSALFHEMLAAGKVRLDDTFFLSPIDFYGRAGLQVSYADALTPRELHRWMIRLFLNFYLLSFVRHPVATLRTLAKAAFSGVEETRYARWFRDQLSMRRRWKKATRVSEAVEMGPVAAVAPSATEATTKAHAAAEANESTRVRMNEAASVRVNEAKPSATVTSAQPGSDVLLSLPVCQPAEAEREEATVRESGTRELREAEVRESENRELEEATAR